MSKIWFVTGCSRGLGREIARPSWARGIDWSRRRGSGGTSSFLGSSDRLLTVALDVRDGAAARAAVAQAVSAFGRLDVARQ